MLNFLEQFYVYWHVIVTLLLFIFISVMCSAEVSYIYLIVIPWPRGICLIYICPSPRAAGTYIRQIPSGHGISNIYHSGMLT